MSTPATKELERNVKKLGPFWLMPGITRTNGLTYFTTAFLAIPMLAALSFLQPMILKIVGVERSIQGTLSGDLTFIKSPDPFREMHRLRSTQSVVPGLAD